MNWKQILVIILAGFTLAWLLVVFSRPSAPRPETTDDDVIDPRVGQMMLVPAAEPPGPSLSLANAMTNRAARAGSNLFVFPLPAYAEATNGDLLQPGAGAATESHLDPLGFMPGPLPPQEPDRH